jgi:hypothetical protein
MAIIPITLKAFLERFKYLLRVFVVFFMKVRVYEPNINEIVVSPQSQVPDLQFYSALRFFEKRCFVNFEKESDCYDRLHVN